MNVVGELSVVSISVMGSDVVEVVVVVVVMVVEVVVVVIAALQVTPGFSLPFLHLTVFYISTQIFMAT